MKAFHLTLAAIVIAALVALFMTVNLAFAHSWYSGTRDPTDGYGCCGGHDCAVLDPRWVFPVDGGVRVVMTLEQARTVNPLTVAPVDAFVPDARIQRSPDYDFHACIYDSNRGAPRNGVICFWAASTT